MHSAFCIMCCVLHDADDLGGNERMKLVLWERENEQENVSKMESKDDSNGFWFETANV